jgi:hypothetical protein
LAILRLASPDQLIKIFIALHSVADAMRLY